MDTEKLPVQVSQPGGGLLSAIHGDRTDSSKQLQNPARDKNQLTTVQNSRGKINFSKYSQEVDARENQDLHTAVKAVMKILKTLDRSIGKSAKMAAAKDAVSPANVITIQDRGVRALMNMLAFVVNEDAEKRADAKRVLDGDKLSAGFVEKFDSERLKFIRTSENQDSSDRQFRTDISKEITRIAKQRLQRWNGILGMISKN